MIKPHHAASIWLEDNLLCLELPGTGDKSHQLRLPNDIKGLTLALEMLRQREPATLLAQPGDLTQYQADKAYLAKLARASTVKPKGTKARPKFTDAQRGNAREALRKAGIL